MGVRKRTKEAGRWEGYSPGEQGSLKSLALPPLPPPSSPHPFPRPKHLPCSNSFNHHKPVGWGLINPHCIGQATRAHEGKLMVLLSLRNPRGGEGMGFGGAENACCLLLEKCAI